MVICGKALGVSWWILSLGMFQNPRGLRPLGFLALELPRDNIHQDTPSTFPHIVLISVQSVKLVKTGQINPLSTIHSHLQKYFILYSFCRILCVNILLVSREPAIVCSSAPRCLDLLGIPGYLSPYETEEAEYWVTDLAFSFSNMSCPVVFLLYSWGVVTRQGSPQEWPGLQPCLSYEDKWPAPEARIQSRCRLGQLLQLVGQLLLTTTAGEAG